MCEWIHECCLWAWLCVSECVSTFLGERMCEYMRVFAYIMWEWLCRLFVWACSLVNIFVSMSMCEWMHDNVCMWKVVWECKWIYGYVTVCVSEHAHCVHMWIHLCMWLCSYASEKCDKWLCLYTHTHHTYECISVSLCMHVDVLEKTFEHVQVSIVECVSVCDCVCVWVNVQLCWCASEPMNIFICVCVSLYTYEWMREHVPMWMCLWVGKNLDMFVCEHVWM